MHWLIEIFTQQTYIQAILIISIICATGLALSKIKIFGISLGVTFVFFAGILAGHFGLQINPEMLSIVQNFGLIIFVYALGVQVGPGFFSTFKKGGIKLNILGTILLILGIITALVLIPLTKIGLTDMMGLYSGAVTNTPMLGAAQQTLLQIHPDSYEQANNMAMATAVAYPLGVIGTIICISILKNTIAKNYSPKKDKGLTNTYISEFHISNPAIFGKTIKEIMSQTTKHLVISRLWSQGKVVIPGPDTIVNEDDRILVVSSEKEVKEIEIIFGSKKDVDWNKGDLDWNSIDSQLVSKHIFVTKSELNGVKLGSLKLRNSYGINITRVNRAGIDLLPSPSLRLQVGDKLTIVGAKQNVENVANILGNEEKQLSHPNLLTIFIGVALGLILGSIPFLIPGMTMPIKLGVAGGPIIIGILMGAFGPRFHLVTYSTLSANLMLRQLGLTVYLACLGLSAGTGFFEKVFTIEGLNWVGAGLFIALIPTLIVGILSMKVFKTDYPNTVGMLCASMANPIALNFANTTVDSDEPSVAYATVYPLSMFLRVLSIQIVMSLLC